MMTDLQTKVEKYETKAAQCEERARQATDGPQRAFYEGLAHYYGKAATDFRQVMRPSSRLRCSNAECFSR